MGTPGYARGRVAVRQVRLGTLRAEWQCARVRSGPSGSAGHTAKWRRAYRSGTLRPEWQCDWCARGRVAVRPVRSDPSGSATGAFGYARSRVAVRVTLPSGVERTATVRSGPSGSAAGALGYARGRVAVRITLPLTGERAGVERSVPSGSATGTLRAEWQCDWCARGRVAVRITLPLTGERAGVERSVPSGSATGALGVEWQCGPGQFVDLRALHRHGDGSPDGSPRVTRPSFTDQDSLLANQADR